MYFQTFLHLSYTIFIKYMSLFIFATWKIVEPELEPHSGNCSLLIENTNMQHWFLVWRSVALLLNPSPVTVCQAPVKPSSPRALRNT